MSVSISIVCPVYCATKCLPELYKRLVDTLSSIDEHFEIILVNDGCPENSWEGILTLSNADSRVKGINLSRNFGQHNAITAGLDYAQGRWVVVMDCDLQDQPEEITKLYNKACEGYDIVVGARTYRKDSFFKKLSSKYFYEILRSVTNLEHDASVANFGIYSRKVIECIKRYKEQHRYFPLFVNMVGFNKIAIPINHAKREIGKSSYTVKKLLSLSLNSIITNSNRPLRFAIVLGLFISSFSLCFAIWLFVRYFFYASPVHGWTSMMVALSFMFGVLCGLLGIIGLYIGKIFDETKARPLYFVSDSINIDVK